MCWAAGFCYREVDVNETKHFFQKSLKWGMWQTCNGKILHINVVQMFDKLGKAFCYGMDDIKDESMNS